MAEKELTHVTPGVKGSLGIRFHSIGFTPAVLSTEVARHFQKRHSHILRKIDRLRSILPKSFTAPNFGPSDYQDSTGRTIRAYLLTRDALSLLVMGITGKAAILWKLRYIEAFNDMEARLRDMAALGQPQAPAALPETRDMLRRVYALGPTQKRRLRSVVRYRKMGLGIHSIAKLLDLDARAVSVLVKAAVALGRLEATAGAA